MAPALVGEQMKCRTEEYANLVSSKSLGVSLIRGVRYLNLVTRHSNLSTSDFNMIQGWCGQDAPSFFPFVTVQSSGRSQIFVITIQPYV